MTPRDLRKSIREGRVAPSSPRVFRRLPEAPADWSLWKRRRMGVAIRAAMMFLKGSDWSAIMAELANRKLIEKPVVAKARIAQYVKVGVEFLVGQGLFIEVKKKRAVK